MSCPTFPYFCFCTVAGGSMLIGCLFTIIRGGQQECKLVPEHGPGLSWWLWGSLFFALLHGRLGGSFFIKFRRHLLRESQRREVPLQQLLETDAVDRAPIFNKILLFDREIGCHVWAAGASILWNYAGRKYMFEEPCDLEGRVSFIYWLGNTIVIVSVLYLSLWIGGDLWHGTFRIHKDEKDEESHPSASHCHDPKCCETKTDDNKFAPPAQMGM